MGDVVRLNGQWVSSYFSCVMFALVWCLSCNAGASGESCESFSTAGGGTLSYESAILVCLLQNILLLQQHKKIIYL